MLTDTTRRKAHTPGKRLVMVDSLVLNRHILVNRGAQFSESIFIMKAAQWQTF